MAREDFRVAFGRRVRELRDQLQLSQEQLAERAGLHRNYVGGIERGERNVAIINVVKLAAGLDTSVAELFKPFDRVPKRRSRTA
ncbi:MAG: transcriptional regulator [Acidobacteria bacterium]|nr:MAG: transcriptional regulator [Acidobacteriota bacterium]PYR08790.1 MAG: transcriptional regulator [Acidobacteriota bacterium]